MRQRLSELVEYRAPTAVIALMTLLLSACGGGGSGAGTGTPSSALRPPTANINVVTANPVAASPVTFDGSASTDSDGQVTGYAWKFGDGTTGTGVSPQHSFGGAGTYTVELTVTDNQGLTASVQRQISIGGNFAPVAAFTRSTSSGQIPLIVAFDAADSLDQDGAIATYTWDFGDGSGAVGIAAQHTYSRTGTFRASLQVTDDRGATGTQSTDITVNAAVGSFTAAGAISILSTSAIDNDVNDLNAVRGANDTVATAQRVSNPVSIGGYINVAGAGPIGALKTSGDPADTYAVALAGGETISLNIGDPDPLLNDLDLVLYDSAGIELVRSEGVDQTEIITAPTPGNYFVQVLPFEGASTYLLTIGQSSASVRGSTGTTAAPFVPGELIVQFAPGKNGSKQLAQLAALGVQTLVAGDGGAPALMRVQPAAISTALGGNGEQIASAATDSAKGTLLAAKLLARQAGVASVDLNYIREASRVPNDSLFRLQWHLRDIGLPQAWDISTGSRSVIVAVIDTGVRTDHPDLTGNLIAGRDFISDATRARDGDGPDADPTDPGDLALSSSSSFHGTHVSGTVGARTNNGAGVAGVAWDVALMPLRVLGKGGGTSFDLIQAIRYAAGLSNNSGTLPARAANVINMSLGGGAFSQSEQNAITAARGQGVIIIAAAGNESSSAPSYPAAYSGVVSVAASTITRTRASYSNFGGTIDLSAPGGNTGTDINGDGVGDGVVSTIADDGTNTIRNGYVPLNGTSMAAPHVAGVVALMKSVFPGLTPVLLDTEISAGRLTDDVGATGRDDQFGQGIINANRAVARAQALANQSSGGGGVAVLLSSPSSLSFGTVLTQLTIELQNAGDAPLTVTAIESNQPWLSAVASTVSASGLGSYNVRINRTGLPEGTYSGTITVSNSGTTNPVQLSVSMEVRAVTIGSNAGLHYVLIVDPITQTTVRSMQVSANNAQYVFSIADVPAGTYQIVAGSDSNNDTFICDSGEACGVYRDVGSPENVILSGPRTDLNFTSGFRTTLSQTSLSVIPGGRAKSVKPR